MLFILCTEDKADTQAGGGITVECWEQSFCGFADPMTTVASEDWVGPMGSKPLGMIDSAEHRGGKRASPLKSPVILTPALFLFICLCILGHDLYAVQ